MIRIKKNCIYLITGGTGYLGESLTRYILDLGGKVRVIARNEGKLIDLKHKYPNIEIYPGDISDVFSINQCTQDITGIFHLAAFKHVTLSETFVIETVKTNVIGSLNLLDMTLTKDIEFFIAISTDKAAQVAGVYGGTKLIMEKLIRQYESLNSKCEYRIVRYGNVLYSTGSVLCKWKDLIIQGKEIIITDENATRFFWTKDQAIDLIISCMNNAINSLPYCPTMKSMSIKNLLQAMIEKYSNGNNIPIKKIGLQVGENMHEKVLENGPYSNEVVQYTVEEIKELI